MVCLCVCGGEGLVIQGKPNASVAVKAAARSSWGPWLLEHPGPLSPGDLLSLVGKEMD